LNHRHSLAHADTTMATASRLVFELTGCPWARPSGRGQSSRASVRLPRATSVRRGVKSSIVTAAADDASACYDLQCPHFATCPGCSLDVDLNAPPTLARAKAFFKDKGLLDEGEGGFKSHTGATNGWRTRAKLAVRSTSANDPRKNKPPPLALGLFQRNSHDLVTIPDCVVHHPSINIASDWVTQVANELNVAAYDENTGDGKLRYAQFTVAGETDDAGSSGAAANPAASGKTHRGGSNPGGGGVQIAVVWNSKPPVVGASMSPPLKRFVDALMFGVDRGDGSLEKGTSEEKENTKRNHVVHSVWVNYNDSGTNEIVATDTGNWVHAHGPAHVWLTHGDARVAYAPGSFLQANKGAYDKLLASIQKDVPAGSSVAELYAGAGAIGLSLAASQVGLQHVPSFSLRCVEVVAAAETTFWLSAAKTFGGDGDEAKRDRISFQVATAADAANESVQNADVLIVDPPRKGLDRKTLAAICGYKNHEDHDDEKEPETNLDPRKGKQGAAGSGRKKRNKRNRRLKRNTADDAARETIEETQPPPSRLQTLIYVSCGFASFERDCAILLNSNQWRLHRAEGFNFFPGSDAVETLAVFKRTR